MYNNKNVVFWWLWFISYQICHQMVWFEGLYYQHLAPPRDMKRKPYTSTNMHINVTGVSLTSFWDGLRKAGTSSNYTNTNPFLAVMSTNVLYKCFIMWLWCRYMYETTPRKTWYDLPFAAKMLITPGSNIQNWHISVVNT